MNNLLISAVLVLFSASFAESAKILAVMPTASISHHIWNSAIVSELAKRGHDVTYFSPDKIPNPPANLRLIHAEGVYEKMHGEVNIEAMAEESNPIAITRDFNMFGTATCGAVLQSKGFEELLKVVQTETFDLLMFDITLTECVYPIADFQKHAPIVGICPYGGSALFNVLSGNPEMLAYKPNTYLPFTSNMDLLQRVQNLLVHLYVRYDRNFFFLPAQQELARSKFPRADLQSVLDRMSIFLANNHYSIDPPMPTVPALVHVGGVHIKDPQPLPKDVQTFLDGAKDGAMFFGLGSNLKSSKLSKEKRLIILQVFKRLAPLKVLWKFEVDLPEKPDNVMIAKWLPQSDVLGHPNVKVFFTHSGLLSTQEAMFHGVPVVGMPFLVDQYINIQRCIASGVGERVDFLTLTEEMMYNTIRKVLDDPKYKKKAELTSRILKDQPETPMQRAMFWIEYVIRHKGANHLRCPSLNLTWYQNELLDVYAILAATLLSLLFLFVFLLKSIYRLVVGGEKKKIKKK